jgi:hypothetical protein
MQGEAVLWRRWGRPYKFIDISKHLSHEPAGLSEIRLEGAANANHSEWPAPLL